MKLPVVAMLFLVLVRATVVVIATTALFSVALGGDAVAAGATGGEIEKEESLYARACCDVGAFRF